MYGVWPLFYKEWMARRIVRRFYNNLYKKGESMSKQSFHIILASIIGLMFVFGDAFFLCAQEIEEFTLEEITVTAAKRAENLQKVPIAMEVISSEDIRELGKNSIDEILSTISNATIEKSMDGYRVTIRGVTDSSVAFHGQSMAPPAVAINTDGVYSDRKDTGMGLFDVERVEVLYGPQSTMYSTSSPGGVVNVVTARPKLDKFEASGSLEVGDYGLLHIEAAANAPLGGKVALRAALSTSKRDSYMTNGQDNEDMKSARLRALFQANDKLAFTLTGELSQDKGSGFSGAVPFGDESEVDNPWTAQSSEQKPDNDTRGTKMSTEMNWDTGIGSLSLIPSYTTRDGKSVELMPGMPQPGQTTAETTVMHRTVDAKEKSMEFRMTSDPDFFFKWIIGANYYLSEDNQRRESEDYLADGVGEWSYMEMTHKNRAVYANVTYPITDRFRATAGYRQTWETLSRYEEGTRPGDTVPMTPNTSESKTDGRPDYKVGFEYDLSANSMFYGDYSSSFRVNGVMGGPGGGEPSAPEGVEVNQEAIAINNAKSTDDPEELKAYTMGIKNRFLDNRIELNLAAYYYDYKNYRASNNRVSAWLFDLDGDLTADGGGGPPPPPGAPPSTDQEVWNEPYADGTGDGRMLGLDLSSIFLITPKDRVNLSVSYQNSEWTDLTMVYYFTYTLARVDTPEPRLVRIDQRGADYTGLPMMCTPPWTINLSYDHSFNLWNGAVLKATLSTKYRTAYKLSWAPIDYPTNYQETYHMEDFNMVYNSPGGKWNLSAYVKNVFNYAEKRMYMGGPAHALMIGDPRIIGGVLSVKF
jgi:iron complex outermembrane recepter protein